MTPRQRWTLVATVIGSGAVFLDGTIVNVALPQHRARPAVVDLRRPRGPDLRRQRLSRGPGRPADHRGRPVRPLRPAQRLRHRARELRRRPPPCAGSRRRSNGWSCSGCSRVRPARSSCPGALSLITQTFEPGPERGRAFGIWAAATSGLVLLGPLVGGLLVDTVGWRFAFLINVPVLGFALWVTLRHVAESRDTTARRFDWLGSVVAALAVGGLSFGLIRGGEQEWQDPVAWVAIAIGVVALVAFPVLMATRKDPLVPLSLFRSRAFTTINLATFFIYGALYVTLSYQGILLQNVLGYTALGAGAVGLPMGICLTAPLDAHRRGGRADRRPAVPRRRPAAHGRRPPVVRPPAGRFGAVAGVHLGPGDPDPAGRRAHRCPAVDAPVRGRHLVRRRAADDHAHGLDPGAVLRSGLGDQQRDRARRPAAPWRDRLPRDQRDVLREPAVDSRPSSTRTPRRSARHVLAAQPARGTRHARPGRGGQRAHRSRRSTRRCSSAAGLLVVGSAVSWFGLRDERSGRAVEAAEARAAAA